MANRRMFAKNVIESDEYFTLSQEAQLLYFYLGMYADDEGFVSPLRIIHTAGINENCLHELIDAGFVLTFEESKIIVIRHWLQNNYLQRSNNPQSNKVTPTIHQDLRKLIMINEDRTYSLCTPKVYPQYTQCIPKVYPQYTQVSSVQDSLDQDSLDQDSLDQKRSEKISISVEEGSLEGGNDEQAEVIFHCQRNGMSIKDTLQVRNIIAEMLKHSPIEEVKKMALENEECKKALLIGSLSQI